MVKDRGPRLAVAGTLLGVGMGGFVDGILLHQIFQTHAMLSAKVPPVTMAAMRTNMAADGFFHALVWAVTMIGIIQLFIAARHPGAAWSGRTLAGSMLAGWGLFNLVEGLIDHHLLGLHHLVERLGPSVWDWVFLASGLAMIAIGRLIVAQGRAPAR